MTDTCVCCGADVPEGTEKGAQMIIITQKKNCVINGNIADLYIDDGITMKADLRGDQNEAYILGVYSTAAQAEAVLLDMARHICDCNGQIYQMPPDQVPAPAPTPEKWISQLSERYEQLRKTDVACDNCDMRDKRFITTTEPPMYKCRKTGEYHFAGYVCGEGTVDNGLETRSR